VEILHSSNIQIFTTGVNTDISVYSTLGVQISTSPCQILIDVKVMFLFSQENSTLKILPPLLYTSVTSTPIHIL